MPGKLYVETTPKGRRQFVLKRSHSHNHHHHHHHPKHHSDIYDDDDSCCTSEKMNDLLRRERSLRERNEALLRENYALKANWTASDQEVRRLTAWVPQLQGRIQLLERENHELRRSVDHDADLEDQVRAARNKYTKARNDGEALRQQNRRLEHDKKGLADRVRELARDLADGQSWRDRYDRLDRSYRSLFERHAAMRTNFDKANGEKEALQARVDDLYDDNDALRRKVEAYERILYRHRLL
ncbi:uncharacterized protein E0L32_003254 [Thyridium curvatum]|uniref:Uncharacterized protein n=1 Tax=Thyridium curvatum TaxID=1093900 RepID=A0A507BD01_9PEZI|nr:uncharacterized protein E0L32_003254 [Thyridium curvatum]TPX17136.1 hypothetical protein E0L32_003254 [Thyridium curvatum]